jgi:hypothetical protein
MAFPSVTNTFVNGQSADAGEVNTNFTDVINGFSDGTKDLSMSAGTFAGALTCNGAVTLGNGTGDDITFTGSLASSIPIKTDGSYDIGSSTLGLQVVYFGDGGGNTVGIQAPAIASNFTVTLPGFTMVMPAADGTAGMVMETNASGTLSFVTTAQGAEDIHNWGLTVTMGSNAVTIALKGSDGNDPSSSNVVRLAFRNSTITTGTPVVRTVSSALSAVIDSGATLGTSDGYQETIYIYAIDNSGTVELAVSRLLIEENELVTTTALGTGADSGSIVYSESARTSVPIRLLGHFISTQATAGTWATAAAEVYLGTRPSAGAFDNALIARGAKILDTFHALEASDFPTAPTIYGWHNNGSSDYDDGDWVGSEALTETGALTSSTDHLGNTAFCDFDGTSDALFSEGSAFDTANEDFSVGMWVQCDSFASDSVFAAKRTTTNSEKSFYLQLASAGNILMEVYYNGSGGTGNIATSTDVGNILTDGNYHHVDFTYDTSVGSMRVMVDGKVLAYEIDSNLVNARNNSANSNFSFGGMDVSAGSVTQPFNGRITEMYYSKTALTANEVRKIYAAGCQKLAVEETANVNASNVSILDGRRHNGTYRVLLSSSYNMTDSFANVTGQTFYIPESKTYKITAEGSLNVTDADAASQIGRVRLYDGSSELDGTLRFTQSVQSASNTDGIVVGYAISHIGYFAKDTLISLQAQMATGDNTQVYYASGSSEPMIMWELLD